MRRVKKTTIEQFDLLKSEMAVHPAAARGYAVGANRAVVDAEWKEIVEKLNALGPPYRRMTEWKKVWSDVRLRNKKRSMRKCSRNSEMHSAELEDKLMEALNSSYSIYDSHVKPDHHDNENCNDIAAMSSQSLEHKEQVFSEDNINHDEQAEKEEEDYYNNNSNYIGCCEQTMYETNSEVCNDEKFDELLQTLNAVQTQLIEQNKLMEHLLQMNVNLTCLMERQTQACVKKTYLMEQQLRAKKIHNFFLRRQQEKRKFKSFLT